MHITLNKNPGKVVRCTKCGSDDLVDTGKLAHTAVNSYYTYRCNCCGGISRSRSPP